MSLTLTIKHGRSSDAALLYKAKFAVTHDEATRKAAFPGLPELSWDDIYGPDGEATSE